MKSVAQLCWDYMPNFVEIQLTHQPPSQYYEGPVTLSATNSSTDAH